MSIAFHLNTGFPIRKNQVIDQFDGNVSIMCRGWYCHCAMQNVNEHARFFAIKGSIMCLLPAFFLNLLLRRIIYCSKMFFRHLWVNRKTLQIHKKWNEGLSTTRNDHLLIATSLVRSPNAETMFLPATCTSCNRFIFVHRTVCFYGSRFCWSFSRPTKPHGQT